MKKINVALMSLIVLMASSLVSCNKITSMDNVRGYKVVEDNRYVVVDMNDNQEPLAQAIRLRVPDTIGRQGIAGVVAGELIAENLGGAGCNEEFHFTYNNGEKEFSYTVSGDFALEYGDGKVYPLHKFTLTGEFSVVSERTTPTYLQISKVDWTLRNPENGAIAAKATSYHKIYEDPRDSVVVHDTIHHYHYDSIYVHDTLIVNHTDTVIIVVGGDTVVDITEREKRQWCLGWDNQPVQEMGEWRLYATDSLVEKTTHNGVVSYERKTIRHYDVYQIPAFGGSFNGDQEGDCFNFNGNGTTTAGGRTITCRRVSSHIYGNVFLHGQNVTNTLDIHQSAPSRICFESGVATYYFKNSQNEEIATLTRSYTNEGPTPPPTTVDTIHVTGVVMFAGVSLSSPINTAANALTGAPEYHLNIVTNDNGTIRQYHKNINLGNFLNMGNSTAIGVTASTVSGAIANAQYPCFIYYNNCADTTYGTVEEVNSAWVVGYKTWGNRNANVTTINSGTTLHDGQDFPYKHGDVPDIILNNANFTWTTVNGGTIKVNGVQYVVYGD